MKQVVLTLALAQITGAFFDIHTLFFALKTYHCVLQTNSILLSHLFYKLQVKLTLTPLLSIL